MSLTRPLHVTCSDLRGGLEGLRHATAPGLDRFNPPSGRCASPCGPAPYAPSPSRPATQVSNLLYVPLER